jgi:hypothetical protein
MSEAAARWRVPLFRYAVAFTAIDVTIYLCGVVAVNLLGSVDAKIRAGAWFFLIGSALSLLALIGSMFGYGWKRVGLALACLLTLPFWYGFTLY